MTVLSDYLKREFLVSNGIGGFCSSTASMLNRRRYHGLLCAALNPPVERRMFVTGISETVSTKSGEFLLSSLKNVNGLSESGFKNLISFDFQGYPVFTFKAGNALLEKRIFMPRDRNATVVSYRQLSGDPIKLRLIPSFTDREIHQNSLPGSVKLDLLSGSDCAATFITNLSHKIQLRFCGPGLIEPYETRISNVFYDLEDERGLFAYEELVTCLRINTELSKGQEFYLILGAEEPIADIDPSASLHAEDLRLQKLVPEGSDRITGSLKLAADTFIVKRRSTKSYTVLAGYPWFTDWGRDTMIAFEGLLLVTGRFSEAEGVLLTFIGNLKNGLIPNVFDDNSGNPGGYNTADATLWLFHALYRYFQYTLDQSLAAEYFDLLTGIIRAHVKGTDYWIKVDDNGLLAAGNPGTQLTWMDVKVEGWTVTPRCGKPVEINALWYNALKIMEFFAEILNRRFEYQSLSVKTLSSFQADFWNPALNCLYDVTGDNFRDDSIRPNQLLALSLPYPLLPADKGRLILNSVIENLYTPFGLSTLPQADPRYIGKYRGERWSRDGAYHQGTVWPWLLGPFYDSLKKFGDTQGKISSMLEPVREMISGTWCGTVPEIAEGEWPHESRGCFSQAWSVAEILRIISSYGK
ncbi:MAG: amylo-alpha-1,6-glucosidase [Candidatus Wallbacteria bacterium]|nr:amylo-alpha-1,6-glucosidase [Candidatus Wallbacteria bacterium]